MDAKWMIYNFLAIFYLLMAITDRALARPGLCDVELGQSSNSIILDIEESRGNQISQLTTPMELPISGDVKNEISLSLIFPKGNRMFALYGKRLQLLQPLDRDAENLSHIVFQLKCTIRSTSKQRTIPVIVRVSDVNDNSPEFIDAPYQTSISELSSIGSVVFKGLKAKDADAGVNGLVEYLLSPTNEQLLSKLRDESDLSLADGFGIFSINSPHQGIVTLNKSLDYERVQRYILTVVASDRSRNQSERLTNKTTLTVNVKDDDDQDPSFIYRGCNVSNGACVNPEYHSTVSSGTMNGVLTILPERIQAIDMDSMNAPRSYSFVSGTPSNFRNYFEINPQTAVVKQIRPVDSSAAKRFDLVVKAEELSENRRWTTAKLVITVKPVDSAPPVISSSSAEGFVDENAPLGTAVLDSRGNAITINVTDADISADDSQPTYIYELTTNFFAVSEEGHLVVNQENLDRDSPNSEKYRFQIFAREKSGNAVSAPLTMVVTLKDVNDNAPKLPMIPPVTIYAGDMNKEIAKVAASDNDIGSNADVTYSIYHVSNGGHSKFTIGAKNGSVQSTAKLVAGEQYSITVQATDGGGKSSQTVVEVNVIPAPNTRSPVFLQQLYQAVVSEGVPINTAVISVNAVDPEGGPVTYSIVSGNDLLEFGINEKTGLISVIRKLDREQLTQYQLMIKAEDEDGLSSTAIVNVKVNDINDKNPEFVNLPYEFSVREGIDGATVGRVKAVDTDEGANAVVSYAIPQDVPFLIDVNNGDIRTSAPLDYEKQSEYTFVVTARDGASEPRLATATVTVHVTDIEDELPIFHMTTYEASVPENSQDYVVTQVKADDPDSVKRVTYVIKQGPTDLFTIDPVSGVIKTFRGLDFEKDAQHVLIVGTFENNSDRPGATAKVVVNVQDRNDNIPMFLSNISPITLNDDVQIGTTVTTLMASDTDGTSPNNKVRYEITGRGKAAKYFNIDPDLGILRVRDSLSKETDGEYTIDVKAYDLGDPQLSSTMKVQVFVRHTAIVPPEARMGFSELSYTVQIPENSANNSLVKSLPIINAKKQSNAIPLHCTILSGNSEGIFVASVTAERNCDIRIKEPKLDHEHEEEYELKLRLDTLEGLANPTQSQTTVIVQVSDLNDNKPKFVYPESSKRFAKYAYYAAVARDKDVGVNVLQVKAVDIDDGKFGQIEFAFATDDSGATDYFGIDPKLGIISTTRAFTSVDDKVLPFRLVVEARDNPSAPRDESNSETAHVVINLIDDENRMVLVISDAPSNVVKPEEEKIIAVMEQHCHLMIGIEKMTAAAHNGSTRVDASGTDVWFYAVDPSTELVLARNTTRVAKSILDAEMASNITLDVSAAIRATASAIRAPIYQPTSVKVGGFVGIQWEVFPYALILIAALILLLGCVAFVYICISWSRYKAYKERMARMYVASRGYEPSMYDRMEPHDLKEYETQVLQMSVPIDDEADSYADLHIDFSNKNHTFNLDNVQYITKDNGKISPSSSDITNTTRTSSLARKPNNNNNTIQRNGFLGQTNRAYSRSPIDDLNTSTTNENVTFREKRDYSQVGFNYLLDRSSIETTTEL